MPAAPGGAPAALLQGARSSERLDGRSCDLNPELTVCNLLISHLLLFHFFALSKSTTGGGKTVPGSASPRRVMLWGPHTSNAAEMLPRAQAEPQAGDTHPACWHKARLLFQELIGGRSHTARHRPTLPTAQHSIPELKEAKRGCTASSSPTSQPSSVLRTALSSFGLH